ncbi:SecDF P1 head subdomain-containing protein [Pseudomonas nicosulfuronedens]
MKRSIPILFASLLGACAGAPPSAPQHTFDVHTVAEKPTASTRTLADPQGKAVLVVTHPELTQRDVQRAELASVADGKPAVRVLFTPQASQRLAKLTQEEQGRALAVVIDGQLRLLPKVTRVVTDGLVMLKGFASPAEAETLVRRLNELRGVSVQPEQGAGGQP